jgi:Domain of unknown function (DUF5666)
MLKSSVTCFAVWLLLAAAAICQEPAGTPSQPAQRITGAITAVDQAAHTVTVKEDKTATVYVIELQNTKSLRKVDPSTLDLKSATRITADDLMVGDRVQIFALKAEDSPSALAARSVILMSARELESVHQQQAKAWQGSTAGVVTQIDTANGTLAISGRTPQGPKPLVVRAATAEFTRYSPENPKAPVASKLADIQVGDQVRIIGDTTSDGSTIEARRIYSSPMRTLVCTVSTVSADGASLSVKDLQTKQAVNVALNSDSAVRKLPAALAFGLARRLNPEFKPAAGGGSGDTAGSNSGGGNGAGAGQPAYGAKQGEAALAPNGVWKGGASGGPEGAVPAGSGGPSGGGFRAGGGMRTGDVSQILDKLPKISATDLKPGDAVVISGMPIGGDRSHVLATNVIAGVEPIFQSASPRQMQSLGDWGLSGAGGGMEGMPAQ